VADVLDLAAGYCDFINNRAAPDSEHTRGRRIAVDLNPDVKAHAAEFVEVHNVPAHRLEFLGYDSLDGRVLGLFRPLYAVDGKEHVRGHQYNYVRGGALLSRW